MDSLKSVIEHSQKILKGKPEQVKLVLVNILSGGHTLIEDSPGVGKTTLAKYFGKALGLELSRIQFTNDLLPSDILGSSIFSREKESFEFHKGPLFGELILADELNRAPPKTQSALLQAMEERSITVEGRQFSLPSYFTVIATQNSGQQIGTFPLPESQIDRFSMKIKMGYPSEEQTIELLAGGDTTKLLTSVPQLLSTKELIAIKEDIQKVLIKDELLHTTYSLLDLSRQDSQLLPLSNRAGLDLISVSKAWAFLSGRDFVIPDDLYYIAPYVLGHRLIHGGSSTYEQEARAVKKIIEAL